VTGSRPSSSVVETSGPRRCMFCGEPADSREHAFPDWLNGVFPIDEVGPTSAELFRATPADSELYTWPANSRQP